MLLGNGDGTFRTEGTYEITGNVAELAGDVNHDGKLDAAFLGGFSVSVLLNTGAKQALPDTAPSGSCSAQRRAYGEWAGDSVVGNPEGDVKKMVGTQPAPRVMK